MERVVVCEEPVFVKNSLSSSIIGCVFWAVMLLIMAVIAFFSGAVEMFQLVMVIAVISVILLPWITVSDYFVRKERRLEFDPTTGKMWYYRFRRPPLEFHKTDITHIDVLQKKESNSCERLLIKVGKTSIYVDLGYTNARWERKVPSYTEERKMAWFNANKLAEFLDVYGIPAIAERYTREIPTVRIG